MERRRCRKCGDHISVARMRALPNVETCLDCSDARPIRAEDVVDGADVRDLCSSAAAGDRSDGR